MIKFRFIKIDKKILAFILPFFCLLLNVSYAEFTETLVPKIRIMEDSNNSSITYGDYTGTQVRTIIQNYSFDMDNSDYSSAFSSLCDYLDNLGYNVYLYSYSYDEASSPYYYFSVVKKELADIGFIYRDDISQFYSLYSLNIAPGSIHDIAVFNSINSKYRRLTTYLSPGDVYNDSTKECHYPASINVHYASTSIKKISYSSGYFWDGESYFYKVPVDNPDSPTMPTNAEIAQVVQSFYDSDLYKNNTNFKDFMVVYNFATGYYNIIGTDNHLLQEIYYDGAKPSNDDFTYPETWWRFYNYFGNVQNLFYGWDYWLYDTRKENDVFLPIKYDGVGKINNLFKLKFTSQSIIVYSSYDYDVYEFYPPITEGVENQVNETTVPGDEYTYNETLDPTDSKYSPIQNYIPVNPSQTIISDVDVSEINKTFEENKGILNIENASWLFTANNKLIGYFIGFLSLLIVFLIISRALGG